MNVHTNQFRKKSDICGWLFSIKNVKNLKRRTAKFTKKDFTKQHEYTLKPKMEW